MKDSNLAAFVRIVGPEHVVVEADALAAAERATFATSARIAAIVRPADRDEVQQCVRAANELGVPLYPISRGKNWGLGSRVPTLNGAVLLDLGRLDRIVDYDESMAHVTVEPGVTFRQLTNFLQEQGSSLLMDGIGGPADASIIGNTVERGHGMGPWADRFSNVCGAEVVLPDGSVIHTGFRGCPDSRLAALSRWGVGPSVDSLFTQSNLGIVTSIALWLQPKPVSLQPFAFRMSSDAQLADAIEATRKLRLSRIPVGLRFLNDFRLFSIFQSCPWARDDARSLAERRRGLQQLGGIGLWNGVGVIHAPTAEIGAAFRRHVEDVFRPHVDELVFEAPSRRQCVGEDDAVGLPSEDSIFDHLFTGGASDGPLRMCYWRKGAQQRADRDIHRDGCGVLWYCPTLPARGADVSVAVRLMDEISADYGFEPNIGLISSHERTLEVTGAIVYDRDHPGEDERALACHDKLLTTLTAAGFSPYRLGVQSMRLFDGLAGSSVELLRRLKVMLDPNDILAPGRYDSATRHTW